MVVSNQKEVLFEKISEYIKKYNTKSLLDIGAGGGELAYKLANTVETYVGIEENNEWKERLQNLQIIYGKFPCEINGEFDMVLSSHSIPEEKSLYKPFLEKAWSLVKQGGVFVIATFKGGKLPDGGVHDEGLFNELMRILKTLGDVKIKKATSILEGKEYEHIFLSVNKK